MMLGWCMTNKHSECPGEIQKFIHLTTKKNAGKVEMLDEYLVCQCTKRKCKCYVPAKDRDKPRRRKKKK